MKIIFATGNKGKLREAREILGEGYELISSADAGITEDIPETGDSFQENSFQKSDYIWKKVGVDCFSDDSGLEVDALGGAPGIYSARYASLGKDGAAGDDHDFDKNIDRVLHELNTLEFKSMMAGAPSPARTARFRCVVTLMLGGEPHYFEGACEGKISYSRSGNGGFGYDPIFLPDAYPGRSMADLTEDEKNAISHRGEALRKMAAWMKENGIA